MSVEVITECSVVSCLLVQWHLFLYVGDQLQHAIHSEAVHPQSGQDSTSRTERKVTTGRAHTCTSSCTCTSLPLPSHASPSPSPHMHLPPPPLTCISLPLPSHASPSPPLTCISLPLPSHGYPQIGDLGGGEGEEDPESSCEES